MAQYSPDRIYTAQRLASILVLAISVLTSACVRHSARVDFERASAARATAAVAPSSDSAASASRSASSTAGAASATRTGAATTTGAGATSTTGAGASTASIPILDYLRTRELMVPVDGVRVAKLTDNFSAGRGGRPHNAHDIMAPRGTPVIAADDGTVVRMANNALGGITIYATDPAERLVYYYAHLDGYAPRLREGMQIRKGDLLGYVGSTGNASPALPHLHFQVARLTDMQRHWEGVPINAIQYFTIDGQRR